MKEKMPQSSKLQESTAESCSGFESIYFGGTGDQQLAASLMRSNLHLAASNSRVESQLYAIRLGSSDGV